MKRLAPFLLMLVCVGDFTKVCFDPALVLAVYATPNEYARLPGTIIEFNTGVKIKTDASVDDVMRAIDNASKKAAS